MGLVLLSELRGDAGWGGLGRGTLARWAGRPGLLQFGAVFFPNSDSPAASPEPRAQLGPEGTGLGWVPAQRSGMFPFKAQSSRSFSHSFVPGTRHIPRLPPKPIAMPGAFQRRQAAPRPPLPDRWQGQSHEEQDSVARFLISRPGVVRTVRRELPRIRRAAVNLGQSARTRAPFSREGDGRGELAAARVRKSSSPQCLWFGSRANFKRPIQQFSTLPP